MDNLGDSSSVDNRRDRRPSGRTRPLAEPNQYIVVLGLPADVDEAKVILFYAFPVS